MDVLLLDRGQYRAWRWLVVMVLLAGVTVSWTGLSSGASRPTDAPPLTRQPQIGVPRATAEPVPESSGPSAEVAFADPQRFAIVTEAATNRQRLYGRSDHIPDGASAVQHLVVEAVEVTGLVIRDTRSQQLVRVPLGAELPGTNRRRLTRTTILEGVEYRYVNVSGPVDPEPRVLQIQAHRATLLVDTAAPHNSVAPRAETPGQAEIREYALATQQRLDGTVLGRVRVKGAGRDAYEVSSADLKLAMDHGGAVLMEAWNSVRPMLSWTQGINFHVTSAVADGVLESQGFRVTSPKLAERAGLEAGDVVVAVNQQPIRGFGDVFRVYRQVRASTNLSTVELKIDRQGQLVTKTYRIR